MVRPVSAVLAASAWLEAHVPVAGGAIAAKAKRTGATQRNAERAVEGRAAVVKGRTPTVGFGIERRRCRIAIAKVVANGATGVGE